jgi:hypothetical protein
MKGEKRGKEGKRKRVKNVGTRRIRVGKGWQVNSSRGGKHSLSSSIILMGISLKNISLVVIPLKNIILVGIPLKDIILVGIL